MAVTSYLGMDLVASDQAQKHVTVNEALTTLDLAAVTYWKNVQNANYTLALTDAGGFIYHNGSDTTARTWTIPANLTVPFPIGTHVRFINDSGAGVITIAISGGDVLKLMDGGAGGTGSRTLAANSVATAIKVQSDQWVISGTGLA